MEIRATIVIHAPAEAAWAVLGERFLHVAEWAQPITASSCTTDETTPAVGVVRACEIAGFGPIKPGRIEERLIAFDRATMPLVYEAAGGLPAFVGRALNRWSVRPDGSDACVVTQHATLELRGLAALFGVVLKYWMAREGSRVVNDLRHMVERGVPSPRKIAAAKRRVVAVA